MISQTASGIWISKAYDGDLLVMDVEGCDGRERGDDKVRYCFKTTKWRRT